MAVGKAPRAEAIRVSPQLGKPCKIESSYDREGCSAPTSNNTGSLIPTDRMQHATKADVRVPVIPGCSPGAGRAPLADGEPVYIACHVPPPPAPFVPPDWTQALEAKPLSERRRPKPETLLVSRGSVGHPFACRAACKYARRKGGCKDGSSCQYCHQCLWSRNGMSDEPGRAKQTAAPMRVDQIPPANGWAPTARFQPLAGWPKGAIEGAGQYAQLWADAPQAAEEEEASSVGSIGHPYFCAKACKYHSKSKGCKDGRFCVRCHSCVWMRCLQ